MTSGNKILGVTGGIVLLLVVGKVGLGYLNQPDDKTLIAEAVKEAQKAGREGRPGGVMDFLSPNLNVNGTPVEGAGSSIKDYIKNQKPDIEFTKVEPQVFGDTARIESPATVKVGIGPISQTITIPDTVIELKREDDKEWFIIPKKSWKITEIRASLADLPSLPMGN